MKQTIKISCPKCGGRACDLSKVPKDDIEMRLKCPRCSNIVTVAYPRRHTVNRANLGVRC